MRKGDRVHWKNWPPKGVEAKDYGRYVGTVLEVGEPMVKVDWDTGGPGPGGGVNKAALALGEPPKSD